MSKINYKKFTKLRSAKFISVQLWHKNWSSRLVPTALVSKNEPNGWDIKINVGTVEKKALVLLTVKVKAVSN